MGKKAEVSKKMIIEAAFVCIARDGYHKTTFETVSNESGYSQATIVKVFKKKCSIFYIVANYFFNSAVAETESVLDKLEPLSFDLLIKNYVNVSVEIFLSNPYMPKFYMNFYNSSLYDEKLRSLNLLVKKSATNRLCKILELKISSKTKRKQLASMIHSELTGLLLNNSVEGDEKKLKQQSSKFIKHVNSIVNSES